MQTVDEAIDPELRQTYERIREAQRAVGNLYRMLAHAPAMLEIWIDFAWRLRFDVDVDRGLRELAILRVAQLTQATYEWQAHWKAAISVGGQRQAVELILTISFYSCVSRVLGGLDVPLEPRDPTVPLLPPR
jgi:alkylhydroperoxidase family enzyme